MLFSHTKIIPLHSLFKPKGGYQSGQMGQTVNLLALAFGGSNPSPPTFQIRTN